MKRIYVVIGELEDTNQIDIWYCACNTIEQAEHTCTQLESHPDNKHIWYYREVVLEEGD
jgi:hypothetical protein